MAFVKVSNTERFLNHIEQMKLIVKDELNRVHDDRGPHIESRAQPILEQMAHLDELRIIRMGGNYKKS